MDNSGQNNNDSNTNVASDTAKDELAHITQEMYKKNFELAEKNKTLSLLRKIDEIILSSVTDTRQIAQQVVDIVASDVDFKAVAIYLIEKDKRLTRVALSQTEFIAMLLVRLSNYVIKEEIKISDENNVLIRVAREQKAQIIHDGRALLFPSVSTEVLSKISELDEIKSTLIYPLRIRRESLGALVVSTSESEDAISQFQKDLIERLADMIGIAIDNALLYQKIQRANERLKELDHLKDDFVSLASHELRTPMTAIKSYLWMAIAGKGGVLNEKQMYYAQRSYNSVDRLIKLVNDMLNISRIESGRLTVKMQKVNIEQLVRETVEEVAPRANELGVNVVIEQQGVVPVVLADADKIKEVIYNLIGNSMKFTPGGGKIAVSFAQKDKMVEVAVKDTGSGIAEEDLPKLFQKFGILPGTYVTNQAVSGTGLGLYICRSLIELHGGKILASSEGKGKGATFTFSLKVFNQEDLDKFEGKYGQKVEEKVELIHTQIG